MLSQHFIWESCRPQALVLRVLLFFVSSLIVYDVQNVAAAAARQHYFGLNQRNWIPWSESVITLEAVFFISLA